MTTPAASVRPDIGIVYLLHFLQPYHHARHYLGATGVSVDERIAAFRGQAIPGERRPPPKLITALLAAGGDFVVAQTWTTTHGELLTGDQAFELVRRMKRGKRQRRWCPLCTPYLEWPKGRDLCALDGSVDVSLRWV